MPEKKNEIAKKVTSEHLDVDRLALGGLDQWPIMEDGSVDKGTDYAYNVVKLVSFTSQPTKKNAERFFNYVTVMCDEGTTLCLPINIGLISTYYQEFIDDKNNILDDHACNFSVEYNVKTFVDDKGLPVKEGKYVKKEVSKIKYVA